jgi:ketosteroid isomerase-like protein
MDPHESEIFAANSAFYDAINQRDSESMDGLWASDAPVACIHPGWSALEGREQVMESWRAILSNPEAPHIRCSEASTHIYEKSAFVVCIESIDLNDLVATNMFIRENGAWKIVHHHAGPIASRRAPRPSRGPSRPPRGDLN